jgi:hypothetical protein
MLDAETDILSSQTRLRDIVFFASSCFLKDKSFGRTKKQKNGCFLQKFL